MRVLGIETSCDETSAAVYDGAAGLLAHALYSQVSCTRATAAWCRSSPRAIMCVSSALVPPGAGARPPRLRAASTASPIRQGPGLIGALLVGAATGRSLAYAWGVRAVAIHHMEGHLLAPMLEAQAPEFPFVALLVSGGHTLLVEVAAVGRYTVLGESVDDAVGEAFDKTAKLLGLPYPGGAALAELAERGRPGRFRFPRPMTDRPGLDFSFSGLKTFALNTLRNEPGGEQLAADVAWAFQDAAVETLVIKSRRALRQTGLRRLVVAGGVGANRRLREALAQALRAEGAAVYYPRPLFCTDNAAMIAYAGWRRLQAGAHEPLVISANPRWRLETLRPPGEPATVTD